MAAAAYTKRLINNSAHLLGGFSYIFTFFSYGALIALLGSFLLVATTGGEVVVPAGEAVSTNATGASGFTVFLSYALGVVSLVGVVVLLIWAVRKFLKAASRGVHWLALRAAGRPNMLAIGLVKCALCVVPVLVLAIVALLLQTKLMVAFLLWTAAFAAVAILLAVLQIVLWRLGRLDPKNLL